MSTPTAEQIQELVEAARQYTAANDRYHTACMRLAVERGKEHVPAEEWDENTRALSRAACAAENALQNVCARLFPETGAERAAAWNALYAFRYPEFAKPEGSL